MKDSVISYAIGLWGLFVSLADDMEALTLFASFVILIIRLVFDAVRLWRYITRK